jgi:hypothetical protein
MPIPGVTKPDDSIWPGLPLAIENLGLIIYIYSFYIWSPGLPITRGSHVSMVLSGSAAPSSDGYKNTPRPSGIRF